MDLQSYLQALIIELVQTPDQVKIDAKDSEDHVLFEVRVADDEMRLLVGRGGRTIRALQSALHVA